MQDQKVNQSVYMSLCSSRLVCFILIRSYYFGYQIFSQILKAVPEDYIRGVP